MAKKKEEPETVTEEAAKVAETKETAARTGRKPKSEGKTRSGVTVRHW